jgi:signal transduction histidine kinase
MVLVYRARPLYATQQVHERFSERLAERERIARELHDTLLQGFNGLMIRFHLAAQLIPSGEEAKAEMEEALDSADLVLNESRDRIRDLRYESLQMGSLLESLTATGNELNKLRPIAFDIVSSGPPRDLNPISFDEVYAISREALTNAFLHSQASNIRVKLNFDASRMTVNITDNGKGIAPQILKEERLANHWE